MNIIVVPVNILGQYDPGSIFSLYLYLHPRFRTLTEDFIKHDYFFNRWFANMKVYLSCLQLRDIFAIFNIYVILVVLEGRREGEAEGT